MLAQIAGHATSNAHKRGRKRRKRRRRRRRKRRKRRKKEKKKEKQRKQFYFLCVQAWAGMEVGVGNH